MLRTVSIATLMGPSAVGAFFAAYSAPETVEMIFGSADGSGRDSEFAPKGSNPADRYDRAPAQ